MEEYCFGGHSKGGNIALYAAIECVPEQQDKIAAIYTNDGPRICADSIAPEKAEKLLDRVVRIVPEFSLIGALFKLEKEIYESWTEEERTLFLNLSKRYVDDLAKKIEEL